MSAARAEPTGPAVSLVVQAVRPLARGRRGARGSAESRARASLRAVLGARTSLASLGEDDQDPECNAPSRMIPMSSHCVIRISVYCYLPGRPRLTARGLGFGAARASDRRTRRARARSRPLCHHRRPRRCRRSRSRRAARLNVPSLRNRRQARRPTRPRPSVVVPRPPRLHPVPRRAIDGAVRAHSRADSRVARTARRASSNSAPVTAGRRRKASFCADRSACVARRWSAPTSAVTRAFELCADAKRSEGMSAGRPRARGLFWSTYLERRVRRLGVLTSGAQLRTTAA